MIYLFSNYHYALLECLQEAFRSCWFKWAIFIIFHSQIHAWLRTIVMVHFFIIHVFNGHFMLLLKLFYPLMNSVLFDMELTSWWTLAFTHRGHSSGLQKKKLWRREYFFAVFFFGLSLYAAEPGKIVWARPGEVIAFSALCCYFSPSVACREGKGAIRQTAHPCLDWESTQMACLSS